MVSDELWEAVRPLLPDLSHRRNKAGRKRLDDRHVLAGILFVLKSGIPWQELPKEMGYGSGMTCCRRLREWKEAGIWPLIHKALTASAANINQLNLLRVTDSRILVRTARSRGRPAGAVHLLRSVQNEAVHDMAVEWEEMGESCSLPE
jgi:transposase